jgi:hypothetical protein
VQEDDPKKMTLDKVEIWNKRRISAPNVVQVSLDFAYIPKISNI